MPFAVWTLVFVEGVLCRAGMIAKSNTRWAEPAAAYRTAPRPFHEGPAVVAIGWRAPHNPAFSRRSAISSRVMPSSFASTTS